MKRIFLAMVFLFAGGVPTFTNLVTISPEVSISSASAYVACKDWWDEDCCRWFKPELCEPNVIDKAKKDAARRLQFYYAGNVAFLSSIGVIGGLVAGPIGAAGPAIGASVATYKAWSWGTVVSDPWDENFQQPYYGGYWYSAEELGLWYTNYASLNNLVWVAQAIIFYTDFVYVSANRATSCQMAMADCFEWQKQRADWGLNQMAYVQWVSAYWHEYAAWEAEYEGADPELARKFREIAEWDRYGAEVFQ